MRQKRNFGKQNSIIVRVFKDLAGGLLVSTAICVLLSFVCERYSGIGDRIDVHNPDILFTQLSLVFLVISFVTLLANKTETVYWVDVIQYRLVRPNHTSIVDVTSYIFANLIISLIAFFLPYETDIILYSFLLTIILLGFLSFKLLMSFFGITGLKEELEREYRMALEFRKTVCQLYYNYSDENEHG